MTVLEFSALLFVVSCFTGTFGVLTGLGGGMLLVPILTALGVNLYYAMGASLISIITTSLSAAITPSGQHYNSVRIGMFLETGAVMGALFGAVLLSILPVSLISIIFSFVLLFSAYSTFIRRTQVEDLTIEQAKLTHIDFKQYSKAELLQGWLLMIGGGILSSILGVGSGAVKVLAMDQVLHLPYKISTATSNFMVGMTASASMGIYFAKDYIEPTIAFPVILGIFLGALIGSKILQFVKSRSLRVVFSVLVVILAIQMFYTGIKEI